MNIKIKLLELGKTQVSLLDELHKRGYKETTPSMLSLIINKKLNTPKAFKIRELCEKILDEWEEEKNSK